MGNLDLLYFIVGAVLLLWLKHYFKTRTPPDIIKRKAAKKRMRPKLLVPGIGECEVRGGRPYVHDRFDFILDLKKPYEGATFSLPFSKHDITPMDIFQVLVGGITDRPYYQVKGKYSIPSDDEINKIIEEFNQLAPAATAAETEVENE